MGENDKKILSHNISFTKSLRLSLEPHARCTTFEIIIQWLSRDVAVRFGNLGLLD